MRVSELTEDQKSHLIWRIDAKTGCGIGWARAVAECRGGEDMDLVDVFVQAGKTKRSAQIHARKIINFTIDPVEKAGLQAAKDCMAIACQHSQGCNIAASALIAEKAAEALTKYAKSLRSHLS